METGRSEIYFHCIKNKVIQSPKWPGKKEELEGIGLQYFGISIFFNKKKCKHTGNFI